MPQEFKIVVLDDDESFSKHVSSALEAAVEGAHVTHLKPDQLEALVHALQRRRELARESKRTADEPCQVDNVDAVVIDFDLARLPSSVADGETLAYLCRVYSTCGIIVGLNQFGEDPFDLTLAKGAMSFADLNIGSKQVASPFLWSEDRGTGLAAWAWCAVPTARTAQQGRAKWIRDHLADKLQATFQSLFTYAMPREVVAALGEKSDATWGEWAGSSVCLSLKDAISDEADLARIAAARIGHWLERVVLPFQDLVVDAPHLVARYPALLPDPSDLVSWNSLCRRGDSDASLNQEYVKSSEFPDWRLWFSRQVWVWPRLRETALDAPWGERPEKALAAAFCEDTSEFVSQETAQPFICGLRTPFARRYIRRVSGVEYQPTVSLLRGQQGVV